MKKIIKLTHKIKVQKNLKYFKTQAKINSKSQNLMKQNKKIFKKIKKINTNNLHISLNIQKHPKLIIHSCKKKSSLTPILSLNNSNLKALSINNPKSKETEESANTSISQTLSEPQTNSTLDKTWLKKPQTNFKKKSKISEKLLGSLTFRLDTIMIVMIIWYGISYRDGLLILWIIYWF
jgi:uncharacterized protein with PhoU and TrkA domain